MADRPRSRQEREEEIPPFPLMNSEPVEDDDVSLTSLAVLPLEQARELEARLEADGIASELESVENGASKVEVFVRAEDLDSARGILANPSHIDPEPDERDAEYYLERWQCPTCHGPIDLMPLSRWGRRLRWTLVLWLCLPLILAFGDWFLELGFREREHRQLNTYGIGVWLATIAAWFLFVPARRRKCGSCGWRSDARRVQN